MTDQVAGRPVRRPEVIPVLACVAAAVLVRLPFLGLPAGSDEAGFLMVARQWDTGGSSLYGDLWVDRPPLLIVQHEIAGGLVGLRVLGCVAAAATVVLAGVLGRRIGGRSAAFWSAAVTAVVVSAPTVGAPGVSGELLAVPWVVAALALLATSLSRSSSHARTALAVAAGAAAGVAPMVKQNFIDALLACLVLVVTTVVTGQMTRRTAAATILAGAAGAVATVAATVGWAWSRGTRPDALWQALFAFRLEAADVLSRHASPATSERFWDLVLTLTVGAGALLAAISLLWVCRSFSPWSATAAVLTVWALVSILVGGSYWSHYLVQLAPAFAVTTAVVVRDANRPLWLRSIVTYAVAVCVAMSVLHGFTQAHEPTNGSRVGAWLASASHGGDTAVVAWGRADILYRAGLTSPYEHLWSLPVRVRDPTLTTFRTLLETADAPTWLVAAGRSIDSWGIDGRAAQQVIDKRYRVVADLCGYRVLLLDGVDRAAPPVPNC